MNSKTFKIAQFGGRLLSELRLVSSPNIHKQPANRGRNLIFKIVLAGIMAASTAQAELVSHFKFNGDLNDETGKHNGTLRDPLDVPLYVSGKSGNALQIDSASTSVECANPTTFNLSHDFTIAAWVQTTKTEEVLMVYKGPRDTYRAKSRQFELYGGGDLGGIGLFIHTGDSGSFLMDFQTSHGITVNDGQWHHVAITYSASTTPHLTLYADGIGKVAGDPGGAAGRDADFVIQPDGTDTDQVLRIGGRNDASAGYFFRGLMDDVQFYNRPLSSNQVNFLFNNPGEVATPPVMPIIFTQPTPAQQVVAEGINVTFSVEAEGQAPLSYQWKSDGVDLPGATSASLTLTNVVPNQSGNYTVTISNAAGAVASAPANLLVLAGGLPVLDLHMYAGITLFGLPANRYQIQYAEILGQTTNWITLSTVTLPSPSTSYLYFDIQSTNRTKSFYRAVLAP